ncbi:MFS transporter [Atlantibacter sp. RC6]|uniref:MFS transporter n=1 Tax=Atlantibacter sp. RC6 TaxID=2587036 RepID=UPI0016064128|nr:MFS transporter [Atlantibacter sp. RC6]MBB3323558.1 MHS family metabolite:H+ symporter-like MFS transporter [Atlantibacter sp. RC6]
MQKPAAGNLRRVTLSSLFGSTIEWYDFFLYGTVAGMVFNKLYFPEGDPFVTTLLSYGVFAIGFLTRPLGAIIFGHFGDTLGRKNMLILTLVIMGGATVVIGLIPSYQQIGLWAPCLLIACRMIQGIGLGGEWGGAVLMTFESAPEKNRAFFASIPQVGMSLGLLLASGAIGLASFTLSDEDFMSWGWRVPFLLSGVFVIIGTYIRKNVAETEDFLKAKEKQKDAPKRIPLVELFRTHTRLVFTCMGMRLIDGVFFNIFGVFSLTYLTQTLNIPRDQAIVAILGSAFVMSFFIPFWGYMADRWGRARVYAMGAALSGLSAFPAFAIMHYNADHIWLVWAAIIVPFGIFHAAVFGTMSSVYSECFDASVRYTGISFAYQISGVFAGGLTPVLATLFSEALGGDPWLICAYVLIIGLISAACAVYLWRRTHGAGRVAMAQSVMIK